MRTQRESVSSGSRMISRARPASPAASDQPFDGQPGHLEGPLRNASQVDSGQACHLTIVPADDRHLVRHLDTFSLEDRHRCHRRVVVVGDDRGRQVTILQSGPHGALALQLALAAGVEDSNVGTQPSDGHLVLVGLPTGLGDQPWPPVQVGDLPMSRPDQVVESLGHAEYNGGPNHVDLRVVDRPTDDDDRDLAGHEGRCHRWSKHHQRVGPVVLQRLQRFRLITARSQRAEQQSVPVLLGCGVKALEQVEVERADNTEHDAEQASAVTR